MNVNSVKTVGTLPGARNIPLDDLRERLQEIPTDRPLWLFCGVGLRGYLASNILKGHGFGNVSNLVGGLKTYRAATTRLATPEGFDPVEAPKACPHPASSCNHNHIVKVDACGIQCPGPILKMKQAMDSLQAGMNRRRPCSSD